MPPPDDRVVCPNCGEENPPSSILTMCRKCSHPLQSARPAPPPEIELPLAPDLPEVPADHSAGEPAPGWGQTAMDDDADVSRLVPLDEVLVAPPREVPLGLKLQVTFGGMLSQMGWAFFGFGMIFVWVFGPAADLSALHFILKEPMTTEAMVSEVRETSWTVNDRPVFAHHYQYFSVAAGMHSGVSFAVGRRLEPGTQVTVEYIPGRPEISRIRGMGAGVAPWWVLLIVGLFPAVGLAFIAGALKRGRKANRLLSTGQLAAGVLRSMQPTNTRINRRTVYALSFEFEAADGERYEAIARTHETEKLRDDRRERLLYDPMTPAHAVLLDALPGSPTIDGAGHFEQPRLGRVISALIVPTLAVVGHSLYILIRFI